MKSREISRSKIGPFSLACTDPYIGIGWEYQSRVGGGGDETSTEAKLPGAKSLADETSWGQNETSGGILDGKIVIYFTHYKVNVRQTLEWIKEAFRKPWFATIAIFESRTCI